MPSPKMNRVGIFHRSKLPGRLTVKDKGSIVSSLTVEEKIDEHGVHFAQLSSIFTDPARRRKGFASKALTSALNRVKKIGRVPYMNVVVDATNANAISFYKKHGFEITHVLRHKDRFAYAMRHNFSHNPSGVSFSKGLLLGRSPVEDKIKHLRAITALEQKDIQVIVGVAANLRVSPVVRMECVDTLARLGNRHQVSGLLQVIEHTGDTNVRVAAANGIVKLGTKTDVASTLSLANSRLKAEVEKAKKGADSDFGWIEIVRALRQKVN